MHKLFNSDSPIGVFDSGIGGLTVVKNIIAKMPNENIIYFGDIARLPYGTKSVETIKKFAEQTVKFLLKQNIKAIVIACNTIASVATDTIKPLANEIPVIDILSSGSHAGAFASKNNNIGIIATPTTINSNAYPIAIKKLNKEIHIFSQACELFVPFIEAGITQHKALELIAKDYLQPLKTHNIDTLILGCSHYPLIKDTISLIMGKDVKIIDPAIMVSEELFYTLEKNHNLNLQQKAPSYNFYVTDKPIHFQKIGEKFLNRSMEKLEIVNLTE